MKNKGFTLAEILGVIVLLALISIISISQITNRINSTKSKISDAQKKIILNAAQLYVDDKKLLYEKKESNTYCIFVESLIKDEYLSSPILDESGKEIDYSTKIKATYLNGNFVFDYDPKKCEETK
jgi:competence protein ComGC